MENINYLDTDGKTTTYLNSLKARGINVIGLDTEGEFNLHHYGEHLCLVQIYDGKEFAVIDSLKVSKGILGQLFENPRILKIMYDGSGDRTLIFRKYGLNLNAILDLLPAAVLLDYPKRDLSSVIDTALGKSESGKSSFQRYDWMRRPIDSRAIGYAIDDVRYLFELKEALLAAVIEQGLLDAFILRNIELQIRPVDPKPLPGIFKKETYRRLNAEGKARFAELHSIRDGFAKDMDLPPNSVVPNGDLFDLSGNTKGVSGIRFSKNISSDLREQICRQMSEIL
ncbi:MAG: 3'-5' exonuclease [Spirochaetales bacterium]|nr:3'-5' exonuclease [Spirochaetales bacterium]